MGRFFYRKRLIDHDDVFSLVFDPRTESVVGEAFDVVAGGGELADFFGDYYTEATLSLANSALSVLEIKECKVGGCDSFGTRAKAKKFGAKGEFARAWDHIPIMYTNHYFSSLVQNRRLDC